MLMNFIYNKTKHIIIPIKEPIKISFDGKHVVCGTTIVCECGNMDVAVSKIKYIAMVLENSKIVEVYDE